MKPVNRQPGKARTADDDDTEGQAGQMTTATPDGSGVGPEGGIHSGFAIPSDDDTEGQRGDMGKSSWIRTPLTEPADGDDPTAGPDEAMRSGV